MDELLDFLKVKLCDGNLNYKEVAKIKDYIENDGSNSMLEDISKYDIHKSIKTNYVLRAEYWKVMDKYAENQELLKRIFNIFFAIGQESFFDIVNNRFYSMSKIAEYLESMENKERLLIWFIKKCEYIENELIVIAEEMIEKDKDIILKAFKETEDVYVKLILATFAIKNSCIIPVDGVQFIKEHFENTDDINKYLSNKQKILVNFLSYAHSKSEEITKLIGNLVNSSSKKRDLFGQLVSFMSFHDSKVKSYDIAIRFDIDMKLYVLRLIDVYINDDNKKLKEEIEEKVKELPLVFRECIEFINEKKLGKKELLCVENFALNFFIYNNSRKEEDFDKVKHAARKCLKEVINNFHAFKAIPQMDKIKLLEYVIEGKYGECIDPYIGKLKDESNNGYLWVPYAFCFKLIYSLEETKEIIYRFLEVQLKTQVYSLAASVIDSILNSKSISYINFTKQLKVLGINDRQLIFTAATVLDQYNFKSNAKIMEYFKILCTEENEELINSLETMNINAKEYVLENLFNVNNEKYSKTLVAYLSDNSKSVRDMVVNLLSSYEGCKEEVLKSFASKKVAVREAAARLLLNFDMRDFTDVLEGFAENEKNGLIKVLILNIVNADHIDEKILESTESLSKYCVNRLKKIAYTAPDWILVSELQPVNYADGKAISKDVLTYLLSKYSLENVVERNLIAEKVIERCNKHDLDVLGTELFNVWVNNGADTKQKWILSLISAVGGFNAVNSIKTQIDVWSKSARGAIACEAIKALALNGSDEALILIDLIVKKVKHKQIKKAAEEAFISAAKLLELTEEDLADKIIPNLDFDKRGERVFDYGNRTFIVTLEMDFSLKITDDSGKIIKTMPKPNKSDDELKAKEALDEFKILKKQIKTIVSTQTLRLEMALSSNRLWKKKDWEKLFVENPIMHNFSLGLVWGVYEDGKLKNTFRYMEDGTFNTKDEEEYELIENNQIGLVHPVEIDEETLESWKQQFEDYEIVQPLPQLERKVYNITEEEKNMKVSERFAGIKINGLSLVGKLTKMGWYRGSVQDGGGYYQFYKEDEKIGIGSELNFDWLSIGCENEETTMYELVFYKAKTVERGSYVYDEVTEENKISPIEVPKRFFSEILYDIDRALEAKTGVVVNWKLRR